MFAEGKNRWMAFSEGQVLYEPTRHMNRLEAVTGGTFMHNVYFPWRARQSPHGGVKVMAYGDSPSKSLDFLPVASSLPSSADCPF